VDLSSELRDLPKGLNIPPVYVVKSIAELAKESLGAIIADCSSEDGEILSFLHFLAKLFLPIFYVQDIESILFISDDDIPMINVYPVEELLHHIAMKIVLSVEMGNADSPQEKIIRKLADGDFVITKFSNDPFTQAPHISCEVRFTIICI
jgi:hypothetical protein